MLTVVFEVTESLVDLLGRQLAQVNCLLDAIVEGGDDCGSAVFTLADNDARLA